MAGIPDTSTTLPQFNIVWSKGNPNPQLVGQDALDFTSFVSFKVQAASTVSTFPVEQGAFATYNKSRHPDKFTVRLALNGTQARRDSFLASLQVLQRSTDLVDVLTPDHVYRNATMVSYDYARDKNNGWGRVVVDLHFEEVRIVALQYASTTVKNPGAARQVNNGKTATTPYFNSQFQAAQQTAAQYGVPLGSGK